MKKLIIVIGQSASGKTTFIVDTFINRNKITLIDTPVKHTCVEGKSICLLGDYTADRRCLGTDVMSMSILPKLIDFIDDIYKQGKFDIVIVDGDRISNERFFRFAKSLNVPVDLFVFSCSVEESIKRRTETGSNPAKSFVETTRTKSMNMKSLGIKLGFNVQEKNTGTQQKRWW